MAQSAFAADVVAAVRGYLEAACREPPSGDEGVAAAPSEEPGWHPYVPKGSSSPVMVGNRPWTRLRLVDVVHADGLILVLFAARDGGGNHDDGDVYLYGERLAGYEELGMSADQAAGRITIHSMSCWGPAGERVADGTARPAGGPGRQSSRPRAGRQFACAPLRVTPWPNGVGAFLAGDR
jgi:hypothetical protein